MFPWAMLTFIIQGNWEMSWGRAIIGCIYSCFCRITILDPCRQSWVFVYFKPDRSQIKCRTWKVNLPSRVQQNYSSQKRKPQQKLTQEMSRQITYGFLSEARASCFLHSPAPCSLPSSSLLPSSNATNFLPCPPKHQITAVSCQDWRQIVPCIGQHLDTECKLFLNRCHISLHYEKQN